LGNGHGGKSHVLVRTCAGVGAETPPWRLESLGGKGWYGELPRGVPFGFQRLVRPHLLSLPPALLRRYAVYRGAPEEAETSQPSGWEAPAHSPMPITPTGGHRAGPWADLSGMAMPRMGQRTNSTKATLTLERNKNKWNLHSRTKKVMEGRNPWPLPPFHRHARAWPEHPRVFPDRHHKIRGCPDVMRMRADARRRGMTK